MNLIEALESIEAAAQGNARLEALKAGDSTVLRKLLTLALSPQITFGQKKLPEPIKTDSEETFEEDEDIYWFRAFEALLGKLSSRELTGNDAKLEIASFLGRCTLTQRKWAERVIKQDLRMNIGAKDVNNALGEGTIFQFAVPLAVDYVKMDPEKMAGKWCVEPKLDGARCVAYLPSHRGKVKLYSRTGKEWTNFEDVRAKLQEINDTRNPSQSLVLDGEIVVIQNGRIDFQALQHVLFSKQEVHGLKFLVFDGSTQDEWEKPIKTYKERYSFIQSFIQSSLRDINGAVSRVGLVEMFETVDPDPERMLKHSREYVMKGFEGAMYRRSDLNVELKRSKALLKVKSFVDDEAIVTGAVVGAGKYAMSLGALTCETKSGKLFEIGSGFSDEQRSLFWRNFQAGKLEKKATFKYQELTEDGIPRFPVFRCFRSELDI